MKKKNEASLDLFIYLYNLDLFGHRVQICVIIFVRICVIIGSAKTCKQMNLDLFGQKEMGGKENRKKDFEYFFIKNFNADVEFLT